MNLDEEPLLSAYLDGELSAEQRRRIDAALLTDSRLAEDLRALAAVRSMVRALPRPALPRDVSASVVSGIDRAPGRSAGSWSTRAAVIVTAAAALVAAVVLGLRGPGTVPSARRSSLEHGPKVVQDRDERERRDLRKLLDSPRLRKVLLVSDPGDDAEQKVGAILGTTARRNSAFGRLTVGQGIILDPRRPGEATVFIAVMDDQELRHFRKLLDTSFPAHVSETLPRPDVVPDLAEVGRVSVFPGTTAARPPVPSKPNAPALVSRTDRPQNEGRPATASNAAAAPRPDLDRLDASPAVPPARRDSTDATVVLVWIAAQRRDGTRSR